MWYKVPWFGTSTLFYSSPTLPSSVALIRYFLDVPCCHLLFPCLVIPSGLHMTHPLHSGPRSSITSKTHITFPTNRLSLSLLLHSVLFFAIPNWKLYSFTWIVVIIVLCHPYWKASCMRTSTIEMRLKKRKHSKSIWLKNLVCNYHAQDLS